MPLTPKNRKEEWLQGLVDHETALTPKNRPEEWMKEIIDASGGGGGTGGGVLIAQVNTNTGALDKTWQEVLDAPFCQIIVDIGAEGKTYLPILNIYVDSGYKIDALMANGAQMIFTAASASDYPVANMG